MRLSIHHCDMVLKHIVWRSCSTIISISIRSNLNMVCAKAIQSCKRNVLILWKFIKLIKQSVTSSFICHFRSFTCHFRSFTCHFRSFICILAFSFWSAFTSINHGFLHSSFTSHTVDLRTVTNTCVWRSELIRTINGKRPTKWQLNKYN